VTAQRAQDAPDVPVNTPDGVPIEELPGWDAKRGVFVLDRSRTIAAKRGERSDRKRPREQGRPASAQSAR
jgi:hypothetical protein